MCQERKGIPAVDCCTSSKGGIERNVQRLDYNYIVIVVVTAVASVGILFYFVEINK